MDRRHDQKHPHSLLRSRVKARSHRSQLSAVGSRSFESLEHNHTCKLRGQEYLSRGELAQAWEELNKGHKANPADPELLNALGTICLARQEYDSAAGYFEAAIDKAPQSADAHGNLGVLFFELNDGKHAELCFLTALDCDPNHIDSISNLANLYQSEARWREALELYLRAVEIDPHNPTILNNLGSTLIALRQHDMALSIFRKSIALQPQLLNAHINYGQALIGMGKIPEAVEALREAVRLVPESPQALRYLGKALDLAEQHDEARALYQLAVQKAPFYAHAHSSLGILLQRRGETSLALEHIYRALELRPDLSATHSCLLFMLSGQAEVSAPELFREHQKWGALHGTVSNVFRHTPPENNNHPRIRLGFVSADLRSHAVARYFEPVLQQMDRQRFELVCYYNYHTEDHVSARIKQLVTWRSIWGYSDLEVAQQVVRDQIHILVDLSGHTAGNRLCAFAHKPAPIQVSWLGYPHTTGLPTMDYFITNEIQDPPNENFHTEQLVRLQRDACFLPPEDAPAIQTIASRRHGFVTLGSLHRPQKISKEAVKLWANCLLRVDQAKLLLFNTSFTRDDEIRILKELEQYGVPATRCDIRREMPAGGYLRLYEEVDIALDVLPWNGGTTTREALWMGTPVVGYYGDRRSARSTASVLHAIGHPQWIAYEPSQYVEIVEQLARDEEQRLAARLTLRETMRSTICDAAAYTRELEKALLAMWEKWAHAT